MYDVLALVVGKDMATGSFAKSYVDLDIQQENGDDIEIVADNDEEGVVDKGEGCGQIIHHGVHNFKVSQKRPCTSQ